MQYRDRAFRSSRGGFTLVEILVVVVIIGILISMVIVGGGAVIAGAKKSHTESLFAILDQALTEYAQDANQKAVPGASEVFGDYPPDNIYVFNGDDGADIGDLVTIRMAPPKAEIRPPADPIGLLDNRDSSGHLSRYDGRGFADIRAMVLAMRLRSPRASAMLDRIDERFVELADDTEYFDPGDGTATTPLDYFVDAWGTPIEYYSTRAAASSGATKREYASVRFVHLNNDKPLFVSYGPNGPEQFASDYLINAAMDSSMVGDFSDTVDPGIIDNELNDDNVYSTEFIAQRLREGSS